jgi:hypothetical protein
MVLPSYEVQQEEDAVIVNRNSNASTTRGKKTLDDNKQEQRTASWSAFEIKFAARSVLTFLALPA